MDYILHFFRFLNFLIPALCSISTPDPGTDFPCSLRMGHFLTRWCNFWQSVCIERTGEQTVLTGLPGDRVDRFNRTISFLWSHQVLLPLLFSLGLVIVMLSLLSLFRFSLIKFKEWSTAQLASCASSGIYPLHSFALRSPLATNLKLDSVQKSSRMLPHGLWYSSSIAHKVASSLAVFAQPRILGYSVFLIGRKTLGERSFQYIRPAVWDSLAHSVRHSSSLSTSKKYIYI